MLHHCVSEYALDLFVMLRVMASGSRKHRLVNQISMVISCGQHKFTIHDFRLPSGRHDDDIYKNNELLQLMLRRGTYFVCNESGAVIHVGCGFHKFGSLDSKFCDVTMPAAVLLNHWDVPNKSDADYNAKMHSLREQLAVSYKDVKIERPINEEIVRAFEGQIPLQDGFTFEFTEKKNGEAAQASHFASPAPHTLCCLAMWI